MERDEIVAEWERSYNVPEFSKRDKVLVKGLDLAFVVDGHLPNGNVKLLIEGENDMGYVIHARPEVLLPNNYKTMVEEGWLEPTLKEYQDAKALLNNFDQCDKCKKIFKKAELSHASPHYCKPCWDSIKDNVERG